MTRVLIGEDETLIRLDLRGMLEEAGMEVCAEARDGVEVVELARTTRPELAILDVKMPRLDGIESARRILAERPIPIVIVSAFTEASIVDRAAEADVFGYLAKPFRREDLLPAIATRRHNAGKSDEQGRHSESSQPPPTESLKAIGRRHRGDFDIEFRNVA
jgi:two-component system, response regulator PdtaR